MSFLAPKTGVPNSPHSRQSYEAKGPVPVPYGRSLVEMKLLESPFNHNALDHGKYKPKGNVYSLVMGGCHGPIDRLNRLWINGKDCWMFNAVRGSEHYVDMYFSWDITMAHPRLRVYWGTHDQPPDPFLNGTQVHGKNPPRNPDGTDRSHPPYAGIFYIIFYNLHFDFPKEGISGQTSLPEIKADIFRRPPDGRDEPFYSLGCNPVAITREILTDPIWGAGLPQEMVPGAAWDLAADRMLSDGYFGLKEGYGHLSPALSSNRDLAEHLADFFGYWDGFLRLKDGELHPGWFPNQSFDPGSLTTLDRRDCTKEPDVDPDGWEDTLNEVTVTYREGSTHLSEASLTERSTYNLQVTGRPSRDNIDAPAIVDARQARHLAVRTLLLRSEPRISARLELLRSKALNPDGTPLMPGDLVYFNYAPYALQQLSRIVTREDISGVVRMELSPEPGRYPENYIALDDPREIPLIDSPLPVSSWRIWELPSDLAGRMWPPKVAIIARRPGPGIIAAQVSISSTHSFDQPAELPKLEVWAAPAILSESITDENHVLNITSYDPDDLPDELNRTYNEAEQTDGYMLALVEDELLSLGTIVEIPTSSTRGYAVERGMLGTRQANHEAGSQVWLFRRDDLERMIYGHALLAYSEPYNPAEAQVYFRLSTVTGFEVGAPNSPRSVQVSDRSVPDMEVISRPGAANGLRFTVSWSAARAYPGDLLHFQIWDAAAGGFESLDDHYINFGDEELIIDFPPEKANHWFWCRAWWVRKIHHQNEYGQVRWGAYDSESGEPAAIQVYGDENPPANVTEFSVTFNPDRFETTLLWSDPEDADLKHLIVWLQIDGGDLVQIGIVEPGVGRFIDKYVAGVGGEQPFVYSVEPVDNSGNVPSSPSEVSVMVPPYPSTGLPSIPVVTSFTAVGRSAAEGGLQIDCVWAADGEAEDDVYIQYWQHIENGVNGAESLTRAAADGACSIPIPHGSHGEYWVRAYRVRKAEGTAWWSFDVYHEEEGQPAKVIVHADEKAPPPITNLETLDYDPQAKSLSLKWQEPDDADFAATKVYRFVTTDPTPHPTFDWKLIDVVPRGKGMLLDYGVFASGENQYFWYWCRAVDAAGNEAEEITLYQQYKRENVEPVTAPDVTDVTSPEGLQIRVDWNTSGDPDWMQIQYGLVGVYGSERFHTCAYNTGEATILLKKGESGSYWVRAWRVSRFNATGVWSRPYDHPGSITVTEDTTIPQKPSTPTASFSQHDSTVVLTWSPNPEIDLAHYEVWRKRNATGLWELLDTPSGMRDQCRWVDKAIFWEDPSGDTMYYKLVAADESGNRSSESNVVDVLVGPHSAPVFTAVGTGSGPGIVLQWSTTDTEYNGHTMQFQIWPNTTGGIKSAVWVRALFEEGELVHILDNRHPQIDEPAGWWVKGWRVAGRSASPVWTDARSMTVHVPPDTEPPDAPLDFEYSFQARGAVLRWALPQSTDIAAIEVERMEGSGGTWESVDEVGPGEAYLDASRPRRGFSESSVPTFYYRIRTRDHAGNVSAWATNDDDAGRRPMPTGSLVTSLNLSYSGPGAGGLNDFTVTWGDTAGADRVHIVLESAFGHINKRIATNVPSNQEEYVFDGVKVNTPGTVQCKVYTVDVYGNEAWDIFSSYTSVVIA